MNLDTETDAFSAPLLIARELATALKVSTAAVRLWQRQGMPCVPLGRLRRYVLADVVAWHRERAGRLDA